ncbi:hypothetical protein [Microbacterium sp. NPDC089696]|uniref:hypothetical protein n=1 Tax=Microbacterium sp. NPDC089696 TaxID=3364199 RepID=UPI0037FBA5A6
MTAPTAAGSVSLRSSPVGVAARHGLSAAAMLVLMLPAWVGGHASIGAIGAMFAFFAWAAVAGAQSRRHGAARLDGRTAPVTDPFAMALLMAVPYLPLLLGGHAHDGGGATSAGTSLSMSMTVVLSAAVVVGWTVLRLRARGWATDPGFWTCLAMMAGMVVLGHVGR